MKKKLNFKYISIIFGSVLLIIDQITKYLILNNKGKLPIKVIDKLFYINYCENTGGAFSIGSDSTLWLTIITAIFLIIIIGYIIKNSSNWTKTMKFGAIFLISGGIGNFIDRACRNYVIDFLDFSAIFNFPIFNFADICIVVGIFMIGLAYIFKK